MNILQQLLSGKPRAKSKEKSSSATQLLELSVAVNNQGKHRHRGRPAHNIEDKKYRKVMQGAGWLTANEIAALLPPKTMGAVYQCLKFTLIPAGLVEKKYEPKPGLKERIYYRWKDEK